MFRKQIIIISLCLVISSITLFTVFASGEESKLPSWIKNAASFWVDGNISDKEFISALQYLVEQKIIVIPPSDTSQSENEKTQDSGFSNTVCSRNFAGMAQMTGKFTNGPISASSIYFILGVLDSSGNVIATGIGTISNVEPHQTRLFDASSTYTGEFASCEIEVSDVFR